jgi:hypothetical protein
MNFENEQMELEHELLETLAEKRWILLRQLKAVDQGIAQISHYFYVGDDGLVEIGIGVS